MPLSSAIEVELAELAGEELERACTLSRREMVEVTPWGDTFEAFVRSGQPVMVERNYLWANRPGGAVLVEVVVYRSAALYDQGVRASRLISAA